MILVEKIAMVAQKLAQRMNRDRKNNKRTESKLNYWEIQKTRLILYRLPRTHQPLLRLSHYKGREHMNYLTQPTGSICQVLIQVGINAYGVRAYECLNIKGREDMI